MFKEIYNMIVEDNIRCGIQPSSTAPILNPITDPNEQNRQNSQIIRRPLSVPDGSASDRRDADELFLGPPPKYESLQGQTRPLGQGHLSSQFNSSALKQRPVVHPKPEGMHGHTRLPNGSSSSTSSDLLADRFAQLRIPAGTSILTKIEQKTPSGPRDMPPPPPYVPPPHPPKLPLDTIIVDSLPRAPSPTYSPARNVQMPAGTSPPRSNLRSVVSTGTRSSQIIPTPSNDATSMDGSCHSRQPSDASNSVASTKSRSLDLPRAASITANELYDFLRSYNILIIDVRSREEYDQGHIFAKSIVCIEPLGLRSGVTAEELEERLIVSPASEQMLFEQRNEFDIVIYYDQETKSTKFLTGSPNGNEAPALRALHDTIYEFSYYKQLRRPPVILFGGLDAWVDLVGRQALQTSRTAALVGSTRLRVPSNKPGRPIGRVPMATSNSSLEVRRRRLRVYDPLDAEEVGSWLEKARDEGVEEAEYQNAQSDGEGDSISEEPVSPFFRSYEEFLRKFPEPSAMHQSMVVPSPLPPARPAPSIPNVPSRPAPAVPRPSYSGVSERQSSQLSPTSRQGSLVQPPLYTSRAITHYLKLPRTGLINFSVTCYMNATIQCLLATIPLSQFFLDNRWRDYIQKNWKGSNGIMPEIYANLVRSLWRGDVQAVRPTSLRNFCARLNPEWGVDRQQDAKEFFDFLVDCLHEDLNINWERNPLRPLTMKEEMARERMSVHHVSKLEWTRYCHRESSFISSLFAGQHSSRLRCTTCRNTSTTYEAFYSISVEIPHSGRGDIRDCLHSYCQEEMLSGDEVWKCPHCKCEREATKRITITRAPQFLVIHFKRFSASKTESARKVHTPIQFPLHGLNMEPYMVPAAGPVDPDAVNGDKIDAATTPPYLYDAYAVMRHLGQSGNGGHYISLVRDAARGCWRKFDDERATDFDPNKVRPEQRLQNEQAYLVFYGRSVAR